MKIVATTGNADLARVYIAELSDGRHIEFVESKIPGIPREKKWVLIISSLVGCPVGCSMCDAGLVKYEGKLTKDEIFAQIDFLVKKYCPDMKIPADKFKIQFARVGEPSFNEAVLDVLDELPSRYDAPGLTPAISSIAPLHHDSFFERLFLIKEKNYKGKFQLQFSIHSTSESERKKIIPIPLWSFEKIAEFGKGFHKPGDKKITLNFAAIKGTEFDPSVLYKHFSPDKFLVKITPLNPTNRSSYEGISNSLNVNTPESFAPIYKLRDLGYDVIVSIGELEENNIGSNCGQYILSHLNTNKIESAYTYPITVP